jgi:hypothetical protein
VRWREVDGSKPRRTFDPLQDALDFRAKRRGAKRWRPEELRQERAGRKPLAVFFEDWWRDHAMVELARSTLITYRCPWEAHAGRSRQQPRRRGRQRHAVPFSDTDACAHRLDAAVCRATLQPKWTAALTTRSPA